MLLKSSSGRFLISSISFSNNSWAAFESSSARCLSTCSSFRISDSISRLYEGRPGTKILDNSAVSYSGLFIFNPFALRKLVSNEMKCPTIGRSPMNSSNSGVFSSRVGAPSTSSFLIPVMCVMNWGIGMPGSMKVWNSSILPSRSNFVAPISMMRLVRLSSPVVSKSNEMNIFPSLYYY